MRHSLVAKRNRCVLGLHPKVGNHNPLEETFGMV